MEVKEYEQMFRLEDTHWWYAGLRALVRRTIRRRATTSAFLLDAGCGTGATLQMLQPLGRAFGVDRSPVALTFCRQRGIRSVAGATILSLPFPDSRFDVLVSTDVLYHRMVEDEQKALAEFRRVLKPDGFLVLNLPAFEFLRSSHDAVIHTRKRYTRGELQRALKDAGFKIEKLTYRNTLLFPAVLLLRLLRKNKTESDSDLRPVPAALNSLLTQILRLENWLLAAMNLPWGSSVFCVARKGD